MSVLIVALAAILNESRACRRDLNRHLDAIFHGVDKATREIRKLRR